ncbi:nuclear transport factor 2 family protein [Micromonospora auratinigra]|uniref:SnoaL-like domain-containing protein n=1 Tax=Micromonospora auratinigra TaxID=261654 RepID=A0A1A8ZES8_9ACTN|nr:nuclear transport factor 2 family protein [Micromonospora auratinigra]SBT42384.1 SnoaL-like domain-containing protein [Micromonospora auratinigra]
MGEPGHDRYDETVAAWRAAGERGDAATAVRCLAPEVEVISPLTAQFRFRGRAAVGDMLAALHEVLTEIRFHTEVGAGDTRALFFHARTSREAVEEAQLLRLGPDGLIRELTIFGRPLPALTTVLRDLGPRLLRRQGRPALARLVGFATAPLAAVTGSGDRRIVPLGDPARGSAGQR